MSPLFRPAFGSCFNATSMFKVTYQQWQYYRDTSPEISSPPIMGALISEVIITCYTYGLAQHFRLYSREAEFIVFGSWSSRRIIADDLGFDIRWKSAFTLWSRDRNQETSKDSRFFVSLWNVTASIPTRGVAWKLTLEEKELIFLEVFIKSMKVPNILKL